MSQFSVFSFSFQKIIVFLQGEMHIHESSAEHSKKDIL